MRKIIILSSIGFISLITILSVNAQEKVNNTNICPKNRYSEKVQVLDEMVKNNELTKEKAEQIKAELSSCTNQKKRLGQKYNIQFGKRLGKGKGNCSLNNTNKKNK